MSAITLRRMQTSDLSNVLHIEQRAFPFPWSEKNFQESLASNDECWVMLQGGVIIAHGVMTMACDDATLLNIAVSPEFQGAGLGKQLLGFLLDVVKQAGAHSCFLEVRPSNETAIRLYRALGFVTVGLRKDYYPGEKEREDALVMQLEFKDENT